MPVKIKKLKSGKYRVTTPGKTHAKATTKKKAESQQRIINMAEHGIPIPEEWSE